MRAACPLIVISIVSFATSLCNAQLIQPVELTFPTLSDANASYGSRMSSNENWLAIGADYEAENDSGEGEVYMYKKNNTGWVLQQLIQAPDGFVNNHFGLPIVLGERKMLIGAPLDTEAGVNSGAVYVYRIQLGEWVFEEKIISPTQNPGAFFGLSLCFGTDENEIIIGAYFESSDSSTSGATYVYRRIDGAWTNIQRLTAPGTPVAAYFGRSVAVSEHGLVIGASGYRPGSNQPAQGAVMLYQRDVEEWTWTFKELVAPPQAQSYQTFGEWIDIHDSTLAVASPGFNGEVGRGIVNTFSIEPTGNLNHVARIDPPADECDLFGFPCVFSPSGRYMMIGSSASTFELNKEGAAHIFHAVSSGWEEPVQLVPSTSGEGNFFGLSAAFTKLEDEIFIGAPRCDIQSQNAGVVFRFKLEDCTNNGVLDAWDIAIDREDDVNGDGIPDSCQDSECPGDLNNDGDVNGSDIGTLLSAFGSTNPPKGTDLNGDEIIDGADLGMFFSLWGPSS